MFSRPDPHLCNISHETLLSCAKLCNKKVVDVKRITAVVGMVPHHPHIPNAEQAEDRYFVVEKVGLEMADMGGFREEIT